MKEIWKDIEGFEGIYQVSTIGRVRSLDRKVYNRGNGSTCILSGSIKSQTPYGKEYKDNNHYLSVSLWENGNGKNYRVHRLVANEFVPNPNHKPLVGHDNGIKFDNRYTNLSWTNGCRK